MECSDKKFSCGLMVDAPEREMERFLDQYGRYIDHFFFSLPMGDRFHSRRRVADLLRDRSMVEHFWKELGLIRKYGIGLEVLFNTHASVPEDIRVGRQMLEDHGIVPEKVGLVDEVYDAVRECFPEAMTVWSFNNFPSKVSDYFASGHHYDEYVVGRQFIRMPKVYREIHDHGARAVLLLNNGCSHTCGGCRDRYHCLDSYQRTMDAHSALYAYSLQSIMPYELRMPPLSESGIDLYKINSRNASLDYLEKVLSSYINGTEDEWIAEDPENYSLWAHLTWHRRWFGAFSPEKVRRMKADILSGRPIADEPQGSYVSLYIDMTDRGLYGGDSSDPQLELKEAADICRKMRASVKGFILGCGACPALMDLLRTDALRLQADRAREAGMKVFVTLPRGAAEKEERIRAILDAAGPVDGVVVNDRAAFDLLEKEMGGCLVCGTGVTSDESAEARLLCGKHRRICSAGDEPFPPEFRNRDTAVRFPLRTLTDGVCPLGKQGTGCDGACLKAGFGRILHTGMKEAHRLTVRGDLLEQVTQPDRMSYFDGMVYDMSFIYVPGVDR